MTTKREIVKAACGQGGCGKGGPSGKGGLKDIIKSGVSGAKNAYNANIKYDKELLGFNDVPSYLKAGGMGALGGVIGVGQGIKDELTKKKDKKKNILDKYTKPQPIIKPIVKPSEFKPKKN